MPKVQGFMQQQLFDDLHLNTTFEGSRIWGAIYAHRQACILFLRDSIFELLDDPATTRLTLRRDLEALTKKIEEHGPWPE